MLKAIFESERKPTSARGMSLVTPSDTVDLAHPSELGHIALGLYVVGAGNLVLIFADGTEDTVPVTANYFLSVPVKRVKSTLTTATGIHAVW